MVRVASYFAMSLGAFIFWQSMDKVHVWIALHQDEKASFFSFFLSLFPPCSLGFWRRTTFKSGSMGSMALMIGGTYGFLSRSQSPGCGHLFDLRVSTIFSTCVLGNVNFQIDCFIFQPLLRSMRLYTCKPGVNLLNRSVEMAQIIC